MLLSLLCVATAAAFRSSYVTVGGVKHHVRDTGATDDAQPVAVMLHGFAGSAASFDEVAPLLAAGGVRAIAVDRVGFG
eukprot:CAMPEP_0119278612 /NCGR_PEP_ID=MMETSP1329-20130426/19403_1 /TAXON_ID=114041 /ORGANISM="Genus nov. species nov., Strain RCC1024" /LENGTH=77 /DNA_ID=CAMNT_0007279129 /DNA_START=335 /DNA_END=564 /DNA_ORIENTATION=-